MQLNAVRSLFFFLTFVNSLYAQATRLQILHTNDLHGYLESTIYRPERGGYAQLRSKILQLKKWGDDQGIRTLVFDAGDFLEGNIFYQVDRGRKVFQMIQMMGYDAVALGNHDWLMGSSELDKMLNELPPPFPILAANISLSKFSLKSIDKFIVPSATFHIGDIKLGVVGLTTDEPFYKWRFEGGDIKPPVKTFMKYADKLKDSDHDYVLALTHIGFLHDQVLAAKSYGNLDLVIGGHSHSILDDVYYQNNQMGRDIPIVQTGAHANFLGRLILELEKGAELKVTNYELVPILSAGKKDPAVYAHVTESRESLNSLFGAKYLSQVLGHSEIDLESSAYYLTKWSEIVTEALKESSDADISMHSPGFGGVIIPRGPITRELIFNSYPRVFDLDDLHGWHVWCADIHGIVLKSLIRLAIRQQLPAVFSGITFDVLDWNDNIIEYGLQRQLGPTESGIDSNGNVLFRFLGILDRFRVANIRVNGEKISKYRKYRVAMPEGFVTGGLGISNALKYLLKSISRSETTMWDAIANKVIKLGVITEDTKIDVFSPATPKYKDLKSK